jgi:hypothetical protein
MSNSSMSQPGIVPEENEDRPIGFAVVRDAQFQTSWTSRDGAEDAARRYNAWAREKHEAEDFRVEPLVLASDLATLRARLASSEGRVAQLEAAMQKVYDEAERQVFRGKPHTYTTSSEPIGVRGGQITTRVGDLCDFRHAIQLIALRHGAKHPPRVESSRDATAPETPNTWYCVECGPDAQFTSAGAMHFDAYGHTPHRITESRNG